MAFLEWNKAYEIGHEAIDDDHRTMVGLINRLFALRNDSELAGELADLLETMVAHVEAHFIREEKVMVEVNYHHDRFLEQQSEHRILGDQLLAMKSRFDTGEDAERIMVELREFLKTWVMGHILEEDIKLKPYFARKS